MDAQVGGACGLRAGLVVLVADDGFVESFERGNPGGDVVEGRAVEMDQEEIDGLGQFFRVASVAQSACGNEQTGRGLPGEADELDLAVDGPEDGVIEAGVVELVGDFEDHVAETALLNPASDIGDTRANGVIVGENLILALIEATENDHEPVAVARLDDAPDSVEIGLSKGAVGVERRVDGAFIARHAALKTDGEGADAVLGVVGQVLQKSSGDGLGVEVGLAAVLENGVHHAHVHEQALGGRPGIRGLVIDLPLVALQRHAGAGRESWTAVGRGSAKSHGAQQEGEQGQGGKSRVFQHEDGLSSVETRLTGATAENLRSGSGMAMDAGLHRRMTWKYKVITGGTHATTPSYPQPPEGPSSRLSFRDDERKTSAHETSLSVMIGR